MTNCVQCITDKTNFFNRWKVDKIRQCLNSYRAPEVDKGQENKESMSMLRIVACIYCNYTDFFSFLGLLSLLFIGGSSLVSIDLSGCYSIDDRILNDAQLTERDENLKQLKINVGGNYVLYKCIKNKY